MSGKKARAARQAAAAQTAKARPPKRPGSTRMPGRRRRWLGLSAAGAVLVVVAVIAVFAATRHGGVGASSGSTRRGALAPDGGFTTVAGDAGTIASLRGRPTLVWFVATWCSSCQAGTSAMASAIDQFAARGVRVLELEMAGDLGQPGPSIEQFGRQLAGAAYGNPDWTFGVASTGLTNTYNPKGYLDIYYLLDAAGRIAYVNGSPAGTMRQLLAEAAKVGKQGSASATGGGRLGYLTGPAPWPANTADLAARLKALGLPALAKEGTVLHIHQHLDVYVHGRKVPLATDTGIDYAQGFISPIHTHDSSGIIHVESPTKRSFTLGQFFGVWGVRFSARCLGGYCAQGANTLRVYVNGKPFHGDPTTITLAEHQEIVVAYGTAAQLPRPIPRSYPFPAGL